MKSLGKEDCKRVITAAFTVGVRIAWCINRGTNGPVSASDRLANVEPFKKIKSWKRNDFDSICHDDPRSQKRNAQKCNTWQWHSRQHTETPRPLLPKAEVGRQTNMPALTGLSAVPQKSGFNFGAVPHYSGTYRETITFRLRATLNSSAAGALTTWVRAIQARQP